MDEKLLKKELKAKTRQQLLTFAVKNNITVGAELPLRKIRADILLGIIEKSKIASPGAPVSPLPPDGTVGPVEAPEEPPVSPDEMSDEERAEADAEAEAAEEKAEAEKDAAQWSMLQKYLDGPLTSVQVQFLDKIANDIQNIKTAVPPFTVEKLEAKVKEWINGLEELI